MDTFPNEQQQQETPSAELVEYKLPVFEKEDEIACDGQAQK